MVTSVIFFGRNKNMKASTEYVCCCMNNTASSCHVQIRKIECSIAKTVAAEAGLAQLVPVYLCRLHLSSLACNKLVPSLTQPPPRSLLYSISCSLNRASENKNNLLWIRKSCSSSA